MRVAGGGLVRRWGGRAVGLAITGVGLYIVAPSLLRSSEPGHASRT